MQEALKEFIDGWTDNGSGTKDAFLELKAHLEGLDGVQFDFKARPGVTYSLRARHESQSERPLFTMVDVIDDDSNDRWLSICFYRELIDDPDGLGDFVPEGLLGEDAACFDLDDNDTVFVAYVKARMGEACAKAANG